MSTYSHVRTSFADDLAAIDETLVRPPGKGKGKFNEGRRRKQPPRPRWQLTLEQQAAKADEVQRDLRAAFYARQGQRAEREESFQCGR